LHCAADATETEMDDIVDAAASGDIQMLNDAEIGTKTTGLPDEAIAARALMGIALRAKGR